MAKRLIALSTLLLYTLSSSFAQETQPALDTGWTPALSMQYHLLTGSALSHDGSMAAFVVREPKMEGEKSEYLNHIWVVPTRGGEPVQYTYGEKSCSNPSFSPDGKYLAFVTARAKKSQVWVMRTAGGEAFPVTNEKKSVSTYQWSPDGSAIAFLMDDLDTEEEEAAKKEKRDVILVDQNYKYTHIYTIPLEADKDGKRTSMQITEGEFDVASLDWAPDGTAIVFAHRADPRINTAFLESDISAVSIESREVTPLVSWPGSDRSPMYSPDGSQIAFVSHGGQPEPVGLGDVYLVSVEGGEPRPLAHTHDRNANLLGWASDGKSLFYAEASGTTRGLWQLPARGEALQLFPWEGVKSALAMSGDGTTFVFSQENTDTPPDLYAATLGVPGVQQLTDLHAGVPRPLMGKTELVTWTSADGMAIEGLLTYPVNYEPGDKYPLVLNIHGGPAGVYTQSFTGRPGIYMIQTFAEEGMAVLRPNPRGSTGYGKDFRYANIKDWGYGDYEDVMSGVDKVIDMGVAHPDSLAVMGWSYGGYLTSFSVTRTDRFKAASMGAGLPNLISMVTTTDIQDYLAAHMGGEFWDDYAQYEKHSAMYHIKNVVTPTQVIHGANDLRVPFTQGQEFYRALDRLGVGTEMIVYPRTPHGPREPKFLMDVTPRILKWFDAHLERKAGKIETELE
ncbi:MAG: S9 family peptidase [Bacteroidota bacterium]